MNYLFRKIVIDGKVFLKLKAKVDTLNVFN